MNIKIICLIYLIICCTFTISAQGSSWEQTNNFDGLARVYALSLSLDEKTYVGMGVVNGSGSNDWWEYDPDTKQWEEKQPILGPGRWHAMGFSIDDKAYVGGGAVGQPGSASLLNDFYEYNPVTNSWRTIQNIGDHTRMQSISFSMDGKGYVVGGITPGNNPDNSVWEYDPTDGTGGSWTRLSNMPSSITTLVAIMDFPATHFIKNSEAYITGGISHSETWRFKPSNDTWVKKADDNITPYGGFSSNGKGYIVGRRDMREYTGNPNQPQWKNGLFKYNTSTNKWDLKENLPANLQGHFANMTASTPCVYKSVITNVGNKITYEYLESEYNIQGENAVICGTTTNYSIANNVSGASVNWSVSPTNLFSVDTGSGTSFNTSPTSSSSSGWGQISATINKGGCQETLSKSVYVGKFQSIDFDFSGTQGVCPGNWYTYSITPPGGHKSGYTYQWTKPSNWAVENQGANWITLSVPQYSQSYGTVRARVNNGCGYSDYEGVTVYPSYGCGGGGYYSFSVYPNPTSGILTVEAMKEKEEGLEESALVASEENTLRKSVENEEFEYALYDMVGDLVKVDKSRNQKSVINTSGLRKGMYHLKIIHGRNITEQTVLVE